MAQAIQSRQAAPVDSAGDFVRHKVSYNLLLHVVLCHQQHSDWNHHIIYLQDYSKAVACC